MEKSVLLAVTTGACLALGLLVIKSRSVAVAPMELAAPIDQTSQPQTEPESPTVDEDTDPTDGWITVIEPKAAWNLSDSDVIHFICPRPEWYPYHTFLGPPIPESSASLDPSGFVLRTAQGIRLHRDGWVVTADGRAYRAKIAKETLL